MLSDNIGPTGNFSYGYVKKIMKEAYLNLKKKWPQDPFFNSLALREP